MRSLVKMVVVATTCCMGGGGASAQTGAGGLLPTLSTDPGTLKPGAWVKYSIVTTRTGRALLLKVTALEREGKGQWLELAITGPRRQTLVIKSLIAGSLARPGRPLRTVVQPPGHQPLLLPARLARRHVPKLKPGPDPRAKLVSRGKVKVAAGTFKAARYRIREPGGATSELWHSDQVPGWPMVKARSPTFILELAAFGKGGSSQVRGKPGKLDERLLRQLNLGR